jgi:hypothetical protein
MQVTRPINKITGAVFLAAKAEAAVVAELAAVAMSVASTNLRLASG